MNSQERRLVDDLFDRLARLENTPRDPDAVAAIADGLHRAPNAVYGLVQTVLVQDEALARANARLQELEGGGAEQPGGFLGGARDALLGSQNSRGSVPSVPRGDSRARWNSGQVLQDAGRYDGPGYGAAPSGGGGSFLGTAAAAAAGVIGGSLLLNSIRGMMGGSGQHSFGNTASTGDKSQWGTDSSGGDLARDAGVNDIGKSGRGNDDHDGARQSFADHASNDDPGDDDDFDGDGDMGGDDSDFA